MVMPQKYIKFEETMKNEIEYGALTMTIRTKGLPGAEKVKLFQKKRN
jgi:hypothetical protein